MKQDFFVNVSRFKKDFWKKENIFMIQLTDLFFTIQKGQLKKQISKAHAISGFVMKSNPNFIYITDFSLKPQKI